MSPPEILALLRRHRFAVVATCVLAAIFSFALLHANPGYVDSATVAFTGPSGSYKDPNGLLATSQVMSSYMMGPAAQAQIRQAGGTTSYNVALVNLYNIEYPDYGVPYATVTTTSPDPAAAARTFTAVMTVLSNHLASMQQEQGAPPVTHVQAVYISAPTGPLIQTGSHKRSLIGLAVLTIIAVYFVAAVLDRRTGRWPTRQGLSWNAARRPHWTDFRPRSSPSAERAD